jgi:hypothetical protein
VCVPELELAVAGPLGGTNVNVSQGAFRLWVVFAVLWVSLIGLTWQSTIQGSFEHDCWFQTAQVEPPAKPLTGWRSMSTPVKPNPSDQFDEPAPDKPLTGWRSGTPVKPDDPLMGFKPYKPPNLCEHEYPSEMLPAIAKAVLIVPAILLAFGLALRWAFMGFRAAKPVDGPRGERARIRRAFGRP